MMTAARRAAVMGTVVAVFASFPGCSSPSGLSAPEPILGPDGVSAGTVGEVLFVNSNLDYVIIQGRNLPTNREKANVFRDDLLVGSVRFDGAPEPPFTAADIVSGELEPGDRVVP